MSATSRTEAWTATSVDGLTCPATSYGGRATAASAKLLGDLVEAVVVDTGALPAGGGDVSSSLVDVGLEGVLRADAASASAASAASETTATAEIAKVQLSLAGIAVSADVISAKANAQCSPDGATYAGTSTIANLQIDGLAVVADATPNQTIDVRGILRVVINEQRTDGTGITVAALHVSVLSALDAADVYVARSQAGIVCGSCYGGDDDDGSDDDDDDDGTSCDAGTSTSSSSSSSSGNAGATTSGGLGASSSSSGNAGATTGATTGGGLGASCDDSTPCTAGLVCSTGNVVVK